MMHNPNKTPNDQTAEQAALLALIETVEATGGILLWPDGRVMGCALDPAWLDLAEAYVLACKALHRETKVTREEAVS